MYRLSDVREQSEIANLFSNGPVSADWMGFREPLVVQLSEVVRVRSAFVATSIPTGAKNL